MNIYQMLRDYFFCCKKCDFKITKLGQKVNDIEGCCPVCGQSELDYMHYKDIEKYVYDLKQELDSI